MKERNLHGRAAGLMDAIQSLLDRGGPDAIFEAFCAAIGRYGFDKVVMGQAMVGTAPRRFLYQKGVDDFAVMYAEQDFQYSDPVFLRAMATHRPFRWREAHIDMTPKQSKQIEIARQHGLAFGYVFPIIDRPGPTGFVSMGRETDFELDEATFLEVEMLTRYAYFAVDRYHKPQERVAKTMLSAREIAILLHVSKGKTNWEVGQILGISEYSVRDYLKGLSARLETSNRTHTVVKAIQLGLILP